MTEIKIKSCFNGNILINEDGITVYDKEFGPATFNLIYKDGFFYISKGEGYHQYKWGADFILRELQVRGQGIYHINMNYAYEFTLLQERATVYLFNDLNKVIVYNYCGILSGTGNINHLKLRMVDGMVKNFTIDNLNMIIEKYAMVDIKSLYEPIIKMDKSSEVIINDIKMYNKSWPKS